MAVRLQMKLGFVADSDRVADSPDTIRTHEPSVGAVVRSKGYLYLLVTSNTPGHKIREATKLVADAIENEYYYDESAGIRVCLEKAIRTANKRLAHAGDRYGFGHSTDGNGPLGVAAAVVRGNELYVSTVGPAEAYLIRQARLSTLPDPHRERGLPSEGLEPEVWRGEISVGDSLVLVSPNLVAKLGPDELKDSLVTLHPQSAMEHLHHRFIAADGSGSDGALAVEATEVSSTSKQRTLVPVKAQEPLAGTPDRGPIPLADSVGGGVAAVSAGASRARDAAGGVVGRFVHRVQDLLPSRPSPYRRVTTATSRAETQRRAAVAVLVLVMIATALGVGLWALGGGTNGPTGPRESITVASDALQLIRADLAQISGPGIDLIRDDPKKAETLLLDAYNHIAPAQTAGVPAATLGPLRAQVLHGLDTIYNVVPVSSTAAFTFPSSPIVPDLGAIVIGPNPDPVPYVLDRGSKAVYRVDLATHKANLILKSGQTANGTVAADPLFLAVGGRDVLILDSRNVLWRWRPADSKGKGTLSRISVTGSASWGTDIRGIATFPRGAAGSGLYNLYVVDPSSEQMLLYTPAADGSGYPASPSDRLATAQSVDGVTSILIDGDIYFTQDGALKRVAPATGWKAGTIGDTALRPTANYTDTASYDDRGVGLIYAFDSTNHRIVSFSKIPDNNGAGPYDHQFRLANGATGWGDLRSFLVTQGTAT
ncbi:MAG TPA: hypothetical protein VK656_00925, partial [Candidatus Acidoferrum sp.]|nr:hypothetical protein [Candidatus Acidoferrum sp.]